MPNWIHICVHFQVLDTQGYLQYIPSHIFKFSIHTIWNFHLFPLQVPVAQPDIIYCWSVTYIPSTFPLNNMVFPWLFISKVPLWLVILHQILQSPIHPPKKHVAISSCFTPHSKALCIYIYIYMHIYIYTYICIYVHVCI